MKTSSIVALGVAGTFAVVIAGSYITAKNLGNRLESGITATWENNENILANYGQKIQEAAQIPAMQRDDLSKVFTDSLGARYGANGSQAAMQWIKEQNPQLDTSVYPQLMRLIEAGRNEFQSGQTRLVDQKQVYNENLGSFWMGTWLGIAGYPKIDLTKYKVITTQRASDAFRTGKEDAPLKLR